jgi:CheY-like chemotaxis protein
VTVLKLLIADDSPDDATLVAHALKRAGYEVDWLRVDEEADFARELPGAELVICDFSMPKFSPIRALEVIREHGLATPLILVSGNVSEECAHQIMTLGAVSYLLKDRLERLGQAVHEALRGCSGSPAA